jgi:hypothetical protein
MTQRRKRFRCRDLGDHADVIRRQPAPRAEHLDTAVIAIRIRDDSMPLDVGRLYTCGNRERRRLGQRARGRFKRRRMTAREVAAGIAHVNEKSTATGRRLRQHADRVQLFGVAAGCQHQAVFAERIDFRRRAGSRCRKNGVELAVGLRAHRQRGDRRAVAGANRHDEPRDRPRGAGGIAH